MGMFKDSEPGDPGQDDFHLGGLPEPDDEPTEVLPQNAAEPVEPSRVREIQFDDDEDEDLEDSEYGFIDDDEPELEELEDPEAYVVRRQPRATPRPPRSSRQPRSKQNEKKPLFGKGTKILIGSAAAIAFLGTRDRRMSEQAKH